MRLCVIEVRRVDFSVSWWQTNIVVMMEGVRKMVLTILYRRLVVYNIVKTNGLRRLININNPRDWLRQFDIQIDAERRNNSIIDSTAWTEYDFFSSIYDDLRNL